MALYRKKRLVLLGPAGSFSSSAADKMAPAMPRVYVFRLQNVFSRTRGTTLGLVPLKNKLIGHIPLVRTELCTQNYGVVQRKKMHVSLVCAAKKKITDDEVKKVYCARIAYLQCRSYLKRHFPHAHIITNAPSTSWSFKKIVQLKRANAIAIGSSAGAELYGLTVLARHIQKDPHNWTEFALIQRQKR